MSSFIGCISSLVYNSFIKNVGPPLGLINYKKESFRRQWVAGQCRNRCRSRGGSRLRRRAAPSWRGGRNRVIWGVGSLEAVSRHIVDPVSQLQVENMCGPLQDLEGAVVERSQRRLGAIPVNEHEPSQEAVCPVPERSCGAWRPAAHGGSKVRQEGWQWRLTNCPGSTSCEPKQLLRE
jgi:hypothetical protein